MLENAPEKRAVVKEKAVGEGPGKSHDAQHQVYDNIIKRLIEGQSAQILPLLFPMLLFLSVPQELNVEILLPPRRMDRVYRVLTTVGWVILHIEIEMSPQGRWRTNCRMLCYHALMLEKIHQHPELFAECLAAQKELPVITLIMYPFDVPAGVPELVEAIGPDEILRFKHYEMSLQSFSAADVFDQRHIPFYCFLPAMQGATKELLLEAVEDMLQYYEGAEDSLRDELLCFLTLLNRAKSLPDDEIEDVLRRIRMHDPLLEEDPWVLEFANRFARRKEAEAEARGRSQGRTEGRTEGEIKKMRENILKFVELRYSRLQERVQRHIQHMEDPDLLQKLLFLMYSLPDEEIIENFLQALPVTQNQKTTSA